MRRAAVRQVDGAAIVPEDEIVLLPMVAVDEARLDAVREEEIQDLAAFLLRHVEDARGETLVDEK